MQDRKFIMADKACRVTERAGTNTGEIPALLVDQNTSWQKMRNELETWQ